MEFVLLIIFQAFSQIYTRCLLPTFKLGVHYATIDLIFGLIYIINDDNVIDLYFSNRGRMNVSNYRPFFSNNKKMKYLASVFYLWPYNNSVYI